MNNLIRIVIYVAILITHTTPARADLTTVFNEINTWTDLGCSEGGNTPTCESLKAAARTLADENFRTHCDRTEDESRKHHYRRITDYLKEKLDIINSELAKGLEPKQVGKVVQCVKSLEDLAAKESCAKAWKKDFKCNLGNKTLELAFSPDCEGIFFTWPTDVLGKGGYSTYHATRFYQKTGTPKWQKIARGTLNDPSEGSTYLAAVAFDEELKKTKSTGIQRLLAGNQKHLYYPIYSGSLDQFSDNLDRLVAAQVLRQAAVGLEFLHDDKKGLGKIHRDIKPGNLLVRGLDDAFTAEAVVSDFDMVTSPGRRRRSLAGTPLFMDREAMKEVSLSLTKDTQIKKDKSSDVYAFALMATQTLGYADKERVSYFACVKKFYPHFLDSCKKEFNAMLTAITSLSSSEGTSEPEKALLSTLGKALRWDAPAKRPEIKEVRQKIDDVLRSRFVQRFKDVSDFQADLASARTSASKQGYSITPYFNPKTGGMILGLLIDGQEDTIPLYSNPHSRKIDFKTELAAALNTKNERGNTPLAEAVNLGNYDQVLAYLNAGANAQATVGSGKSIAKRAEELAKIAIDSKDTSQEQRERLEKIHELIQKSLGK